MGQSFVKIYLHITFSTKNREEFILAPHDQKLYSYLAGLSEQLDYKPIKIGGHKNHVHLLVMSSKKRLLPEFMQKLKANSSRWFKKQSPKLEGFYWQDGYAAFSVNPSEVDRVVQYIENQEEHHSKQSFEDEYLSFLKKYKVPFEEKYLWE